MDQAEPVLRTQPKLPASSGPDAGRTLTIEEPAHTPALSVLLGFGAMVPLAVLAIGCWVLPVPWTVLARDAAVIWGSAILCFLAGVRRGLSFRTPGGPTVSQIATMLWLFVLGLAALATGSLAYVPVLLLLMGYVSLAILDPLAARRQEAPLFFERLRPVQMVIPLLSLLAILARTLS